MIQDDTKIYKKMHPGICSFGYTLIWSNTAAFCLVFFHLFTLCWSYAIKFLKKCANAYFIANANGFAWPGQRQFMIFTRTHRFSISSFRFRLDLQKSIRKASKMTFKLNPKRRRSPPRKNVKKVLQNVSFFDPKVGPVFWSHFYQKRKNGAGVKGRFGSVSNQVFFYACWRRLLHFEGFTFHFL